MIDFIRIFRVKEKIFGISRFFSDPYLVLLLIMFSLVNQKV